MVGAMIIGVLDERVVASEANNYLASVLVPGITAGVLYSVVIAVAATLCALGLLAARRSAVDRRRLIRPRFGVACRSCRPSCAASGSR